MGLDNPQMCEIAVTVSMSDEVGNVIEKKIEFAKSATPEPLSEKSTGLKMLVDQLAKEAAVNLSVSLIKNLPSKIAGFTRKDDIDDQYTSEPTMKTKEGI